MKEKILSFIKYVMVFIILILIFNAFLYIVCSFPSTKLEKNVYESYNELAKEGMFYITSDALYLINNNCTDTVIINEAYSVDNKNPYESYMKARKNYKRGLTQYELEESTGEGVTVNYYPETDKEEVSGDYEPIAELGNFLNERIHTSLNYGRYWHGYLILYRPLLLLFNISQIRTALLVTYLALFIGFIYVMNKRFGKAITILFGSALIFSGYFSASFSLESSSIFLMTMISSIILVKRIDKIKNFSIYIFIVACIANFVDYLTVPLISLGIPLSIYLLKLIEEGKDYKDCLKFLIKNSIVWFLGYAGTWICKWILYDLTISGSKSMLKIGFVQSFYRMERINYTISSSDKYIYHTIIDIISKSTLYSIIPLGVVMYINKFNISVKEFNKKCLPFLLLSLYPIVWYLFLANHTVMHWYFTYRQSLVFMLGLLLMTNELLFGQNRELKIKKNK